MARNKRVDTAISTITDIAAKPSQELITKWLSRVAAGRDRKSFESLYEEFAPKIKSYMLRHGANLEEADDLAQETMVQVWRKAEQFDSTRATPAAWIFRIARNLQIDRLRKRKFHEVEFTAEAEVPDEGTSSHERTAQYLDAEKLSQLVQDLPDEQLEVIRLAFFDGLTHAEIGNRLELPLGTVKSRMRLAFGKLRTAMGETR